MNAVMPHAELRRAVEKESNLNVDAILRNEANNPMLEKRKMKLRAVARGVEGGCGDCCISIAFCANFLCVL